MKKRKILRERRKRARIVPLVLALVMVVTMVNPSYVNASDGANENSGGFFSNAIEAVADFFGIGDETETAEDGVQTFAVENADSTVDPDTTNDWTQYTRPSGQPSTQNVGRIWTDKSVFKEAYTFTNDSGEGLNGESISKGDSDFVVSLSALSSTSNLKSTTTTTTPLDIVLVLDLSGSMNDSLSSSREYTPVYDISTDGWTTYYAQREDGSYAEIERVTRESWPYRFDHWELDGHEVEPMRSASDTQSGRIQFYTYQTVNQSKMDALKSAANQFIDSVGDLNQNVTDENDLSRIAIVKYADDTYNYSIGDDTQGGLNDYNYTQVVSDFSSNADDLKSDINGLEARGGTAADYGLTMAQYVLEGGQYGGRGDTYQGARDDAQKVVIFFTDGEPNHGNGFDDDVAATSVNTAHTMKQSGTTVYTIGVLNGADPSADPADRWTSDVNKYLHAVSSNYKGATAENWRGNASWDDLELGDRTQDKDGGNANYYYAAEDSAQLDQVFEDITSSITENAGSGSPIIDNSTEGNTDPGDLIFTDQLGSYMQVTGIGEGDDKIQLAYGDRIYTSTEKTTEGNVDTYHFDGKVDGNAVYGEADLADLVVTVTRSNDLATGDNVKVTIPASLIPLRNYNVDTDNSTMTVSQAYPVRLFYGVSLKDGVMDALDNPSSSEYAAIIGSQASADKMALDFYSNSFIKDAADGSTTAEFTPNEGNKFYYYTSNTQLYLDQACTQPATESNSANQDTLYYKDVYWTLTGNGDEASEVTDGYGTITRNGAEWQKINWGNGYTDQAYIPAHTERADRPATMTDAKEDNTTGTATNVLNPAWVGGSVKQHLGNNGKLSIDMPGSFEIKKTVNWENASDKTEQDKNSFTFEVSLVGADDMALTGSYPYYVSGSDEAAGTVSNGGTITIAGGQSVEVKGLPAGSKFTVTEQKANQNGFITTDSTDQQGQENEPNDGTVNGTIAAGARVSVSFVNTYHASDVNLNTNTTLKVQKNLEDRDWRDTDSFDFTISGFRAPAGVDPIPMPEETTVTIDAGDKDSNYTASFGDITFSVPGEYRYTIQENSDPEQPIAGINYSEAIYRVIVMVGDNGTGSLTIDSVTIERMQDDNGEPVGQGASGEAVQGNTTTFTNTYNASIDTEGIQGVKSYNDTTGGNGFEPGKFTFQLEAKGGFVTDSGSAEDLTISAEDTPMPQGAQNNTITTGNVGENFTFPNIIFDGNNAGNTYVYKVTEVDGNESGMTYSDAEHTVMIKVEEVTDGEGAHIMATVLGDYVDPSKLVFENTYDPTDVTLTGDTAIHGTKSLTGRDMKDSETFYFQLTATNDNAKSILPAAQTVAVTKDNMQDGFANFSFGDISFSKTGIYTFTVKEVADENGTGTSNGSGMTYDTNICTVTVTVTDGNDSDNPDDHGRLLATVAYSNDRHADESGKALFENVYKASVNYGVEGGIEVTKQLTNRPMRNNEFTFSIAGTDSDNVKADEANAKLTEADKSFKNTGAAANATITMAKLQNVSFDQTDAGKTYSYIVDEITEDDADALPGVTCDQTQYRVDIQVVDNGDGTMHTLTTVTKIKNAAGEEANELVIDAVNSDEDGYVIPAFGFVNEYNPTPAEAGEGTDHAIQVTKTVTGAPSPDNVSYSFTLTATGDNIGNIAGLDDSNQLHVSTTGVINEGESQTLDFEKLTFSKPGTYTFTVQEDTPTAADGWSYDTEAKTVAVEVTDLNSEGQYDGKLYIRNVTGSPVDVTNSYDPDSVVVGGEGADQQITVQKSVTGADSVADFQFKIEPIDPDDEKWKNVEAVSDDFDALASITGGVTQAQSGTATFEGIKFNATGEYQFKITEVGAADFNAGDNRNGWTYDEHVSTVTVTVTDENFDGHLDAQLSYDNSDATTEDDKSVDNAAAFTNAYVPGSVTVGGDETGLRATKQVTGAPATEEFEFTLRLTSDNAANVQGLNENNSITKSTTGLTGKEDATETIDFGDLTFSAEGIYTFTVTENNTTDADGWTYGTGSGAVITVTVTDEGHDGQLDATTIVEVNGEQVDTNNPTIVNSYDPGSVTIGDGEAAGPIQVTKNIEGTAPAAEDFSFTLTFTPDAEGNTGKAENIQGLTNNSLMTSVSRESLLEDNTETAAFGKLTFTEEGDYYFTVTENNQAAENSGWTYDNSPKTVIVHVTDTDHNGHLEASVDDDAAVITNSYVPGSVTVGGDETGLQVTKQVTGAPALSEFAFTLQLTSDNAANVEGLGEGNAITESTTGLTGKEDSETVDFGELTFTAVGDYVFTVKEDTEKPADADGWTYDNSSYTITVHVTDENYDGQLDATVEGNNPTVTNQYKANEVVIGGDSGNTGIAVQKTLFGRNWQEGDSFSFTLAAADGTPMPVEGEEIVTISNEDTEKTAEFGAITYTETGTYHYTVTEAGGNIGGVTYDKHIANVTVNVTDENYDGQLDAEVTYDNNTEGVYEDDADVTTIAAFTNTYEPGGTVQPGTGDAKAQLTKELVGRDWMEGDQFSFTITADEDTPAETLPAETTVTVGKPESGNSNTFDFGPFTFNAEGVYHYTVREEGAGTTVNGITYSNNVAHITIDVTDDLHGGFAASVTITNEKFINTYSAGLDYGAEGGLNLVKRLDGHDIAAGQFQFQVTPVSGDGYVSAEDAAKKAGIEESGLTVSTDAASMVDGVAVDSIALFNQMKFDQTDNGKTYAYQISEVQETKAGYQYDKTTYTVTISVSDDNNGVLTVTTVVSNGTDSTAYVYTSEDGQNTPAQVVFNNAYDGAGSLGGEGAVSIQADKELLNGQLSGNDFTFIVTDKNEAEVTRGTNDASGKITFNEVAYTTDKLIADLASGAASYDADSSTYTYQYTVTEDTSNFQDMGVIANVAHFNITVTVKDNGDGTLTTAVDYGQYGDGLTFQNTYGTGADIAVNIGGTKELAHADGLTPPDITGAYQFTISGQDENGNAAPLPENTTASNDANGNVSFGAIQYTMENVFGTTAGETASDDVAAGEDGIDTQIAQRTKTYTYTVTESGNVAGVTNDQEASKTFTIVVTDNGDGTLSVTDGAGNTVVPGAQFTFVNTYSVTPYTSTPTGDGGITITKNLEGRALNEGEFTFEMTGLAGTISEGMAVTGTNDAAGNVALGGLEFSRPGTYEFRISEVIPETPAGGVTYDGMTYQATAEVTDNHDGTLAVAWTVKAAADGEALEQVTFTNTYKAAPAGVQFGALKRLDGDARDLKAGEFTFQVKDESGKVVATAKNKADGSVRFDSITFDKAGTYTYTISEVKGSDETITYDETVYTAIVNVTDDLNGQLYASVTAEDGSALKMTFTNKYTKPAVPVEPDEGPTAVRTGDTAPILPIILVMAAALAAIIAAAAVILRRNRRQ
ncbi:MAG TPA: VWA domain-containing protein [Lachnoclostridium phocaeense]|uniref:VWA domain-containing protein n=1 Tax=Lachnoclostridium phocaeense TaxID=1871021 RepID=A0A921I1F5_9FIRM|nr:VWA domain-containing protein [Lachnoclostridium phocaeense]